MRMLILALLVLIPGPASAGYKIKFDLISSPTELLGMRELNDGNWLAGFSKQAASLRKDDVEKLHLNAFSAWRVEGGDIAYGLGLGVPLGNLGDGLLAAVRSVAPNLEENMKWLPKVGSFLSLDTYVGYRFKHGPDVHPLVYGIGGKVSIPFDILRGL